MLFRSSNIAQIFLVVSAVLLPACAGGSRGTGVRSVLREDGQIEADSDDFGFDRLFEKRTMAVCRFGVEAKSELFVHAPGGFSSVEDAADKPCAFVLRSTDDPFSIELVGIPQHESAQLSLIARSADGSFLWQRRSAHGQLVLAVSDIPRDGAIEVLVEGPSIPSSENVIVRLKREVDE